MQAAVLEPRRAAAAVLILALATFAAYGPALHGAFLWDDDRIVSENPLMTAPDGLRRLWRVKETDQYYPLVFTSFWAERKVWGLDTRGYHAVNVLLHVLNAVLVWLLLARLGLKSAWLAAAVFALHPVHVESVAWISERKNVLSGFFYLLALWSYLNFEEEERPGWYAAAIGLFACALLSKTVTCSLPVILLLLRWWKGRPIRLQHLARMAPFLLLGAAAGLLTAWVETSHAGAQGADWRLDAFQRLILSGRALWFYAGKLAWPAGLCFSYPRWELDPRQLGQWAYLIAAGAAAIALWRSRERLGRGALAGAAFFTITLFPALGFFSIFPQRYSYVADHFQYLASLGLISLLLEAASRRLPARALAAVLLPACAVLTWRQARVYRDVDVLWEDTLRKNPSSFLAHLNLGHSLFYQGRVEEAIGHFEASLALKPDALETLTSYGSALAAQGKWERAIPQYETALKIAPNYVDGHNLLGLAFAARGRWPEAIGQYQESLRYNPRYVNAYINIGDALAAQGKLGEAAGFYSRVLWVNENLPPSAYYNMGRALAAGGDQRAAARHFQEAFRLQKDRR